MKKETYIYGLDLSMSSSGIAIFTNDGKFLECFTVETKPSEETRFRLKHIGEYFINLMRKYPPEIVIIEQGFTLFNKSTQAIFRVNGLVNYLFSHVEQIYYPATTVKKEIAGIGNAKKEDVLSAIHKRFPDLKFRNMDESDAFAVALTYLKKEKGIG